MRSRVNRSTLFNKVDWKAVGSALLPYAARLVNGKSTRVKGTGVGPDDLAAEVITRLVDPEAKRPTWDTKKYGDPTTKGVIGFLKPVLLNHFLDELKKGAYKNTVDALPPVEQLRSYSNNDLKKVHLKLRFEEIKATLRQREDAEAELYMEIVLDRIRNGDKPPTNQEAAEELGVKASDIVNIRKRIQRTAARRDS